MRSGHLPQGILTHKAATIARCLDRIPSSVPRVASAAALAARGHLATVDTLSLYNVSTSSVPAEEMASLVRCVRCRIKIIFMNIRSHEILAVVFKSVHCRTLAIKHMILDTPTTQGLLGAMVSGVKEVELDDVIFDTESLIQYDGRGECAMVVVKCYRDRGSASLQSRLKDWARDVGWSIESDIGCVMMHFRLTRRR